MRDGEFMVFNVNDIFSLAIFVYIRDIDDIKLHHL